jgi:hypothetical protein
MTLGPRAKLLILAALFASPIVASFIAYHFVPLGATGNYGELVAPRTVTTQAFERPGGGRFAFRELQGRWAMVASDSGACGAPCEEKLTTMRQVRLALGRRATRLERVFVVDDAKLPTAELLKQFEGTVVAITPGGLALPPGSAGSDRGHIYLVDPHGNVMLRWPVPGDRKRMLKDLDRLLRASQIG